MILSAILGLFSAGCSRADSNVWELIEKGALVIDVRTAAEFATGHIEGAINIPYEKTDELVAAIGSDTSKEVVLYCRSGRRSGIAVQALRQRGYEQLTNGGAYTHLVRSKPQR